MTEPGEQYMWCNHLIHVDGKVLTDSKLAKKGILKVKDVIDEDGELRRYNTVKHKINNQAEIYLKLLKIKKSNTQVVVWKMFNKTQNPVENYLKVEIKGKPKQLETLTSRYLQNINPI